MATPFTLDDRPLFSLGSFVSLDILTSQRFERALHVVGLTFDLGIGIGFGFGLDFVLCSARRDVISRFYGATVTRRYKVASLHLISGLRSLGQAESI